MAESSLQSKSVSSAVVPARPYSLLSGFILEGSGHFSQKLVENWLRESFQELQEQPLPFP